ncbi:MAG: hypothetical protein K8L91_29790 [Anaerolineae bacterium]|nr:hypothetical protein [Anaerolineae bacterium]
MSNKLFVAQLPRTVSAEELRELFSQVGLVRDVKRPRDHETGELRTFGFVTMASDELALQAIEQLDGHVLGGNAIVVKIAEEKPATDRPANAPAAPAPKPSVPKPVLPPQFDYARRGDLLQQLVEGRGASTTAKMTLVGRPDRVDIIGQMAVLVMEHMPKTAGFPKGVPTPPAEPTLYAVYIGLKQWRKVEEAIKDPEDVLIIEGMPVHDAALPGTALFATMVITKLMQAAARPKLEEDGESAPAPAE